MGKGLAQQKQNVLMRAHSAISEGGREGGREGEREGGGEIWREHEKDKRKARERDH